MKFLTMILIFVGSFSIARGQEHANTYLSNIKKELTHIWPNNRVINLVFYGDSVPAGYWDNHEVHTLQSYPYLVLKKLKKQYPFAVINVIVEAKGGENSIQGEKRFKRDVLSHKPDILFIDYALNDRFVKMEKVRHAWEEMIQKALKKNIKVILITPSPDQRIDMLNPDNPLFSQVRQIRELAQKYKVGLADPYKQFKKSLKNGHDVKEYMSHVNHPNNKGHEVIAIEIMKWFKKKLD